MIEFSLFFDEDWSGKFLFLNRTPFDRTPDLIILKVEPFYSKVKERNIEIFVYSFKQDFI